MNIDVFLPCRSSSERIKKKNIKRFSNFKFGLLELKILQLIKIRSIKNVVVSTNDKKIINFLKNNKFKKVIVIKRPNYLCGKTTSTDSLIKYVPKILKSDHILWTHVTSPFFGNIDYENAIKIYKKRIKKNDSLLGVNKMQNFLYDKKKPVNFNKKKEKWPRTQTLKKLYEVNNAIFINSRKNYIKYDDRIGKKPFLLEIEKIKSFDIDWPEDFLIAENIYETLYKQI